MNIVVVLCLALSSTIWSGCEAKCGCQTQYKKVGCYKDKDNDRALPLQIASERDTKSNVFNGHVIEWHNWDEFMPAMVCRCAELAREKGYQYFGLQYWGECWSGASPDEHYNTHGVGEKCYGNGYKPCSEWDENCVGAAHHNFVYKIETYECPFNFERLGCYWDDERDNELLLTARDPSSPKYCGENIDWKNWDLFVPEFACKCAEAAANKNYSTFGLQYYGECWSGEKLDTTYFEHGGSGDCVDTCWKPCSTFNRFCMGQSYTNAVYRITHPSCFQEYEAVGCFTSGGGIFPELMVNDVAPGKPQFSGNMLSFGDDWDTEISNLICRCAQKVKEKNYLTFGITRDGECWSGVNADLTYDQNGESSSCRQKGVDNLYCNDNRRCAGNQNSFYVFNLVEDSHLIR